MTASWIAYSLLVGALLAATACWLESVCRLANRPARWVWAGAISLTLSLAALAPHRTTAPSSTLRVPAPSVTIDAAPVTLVRQRSPLAAAVRAVIRAERRTVAWVQDALARTDRLAPAQVGRGFGALWLASSTVIVLLFGAVYLRFAAARRRWPVAELHGERVRIAPDAGPAVVGLSQPEIVVPRWLLARSADEQRLVLVHEREHVIARDPLLLAAACAAVALMPWNPALWWMLSRLHLAVELDCDHRVLDRGVEPGSYGTLLIDLAGRCSGLPVGAPALADRSSHLERRLYAMLPTRARFPRLRTAALGSVAGLALLAACEARIPTAAEIDEMDASKAAATVQDVSFMKVADSNIVHTIDGRPATMAQAQALKPNEIASIEVEKHDANGVVGSRMHIKTRAAAGLAPVAMDDSGQHIDLRVRRPGEAAPRDTATHNIGFRQHSHSVSVKSGAVSHENAMQKFGGVILLDGVRVNHTVLRTMNHASIVSVEVVKGPAAAALYDAPEAANGVIKITTRAAPKQ